MTRLDLSSDYWHCPHTATDRIVVADGVRFNFSHWQRVKAQRLADLLDRPHTRLLPLAPPPHRWPITS